MPGENPVRPTIATQREMMTALRVAEHNEHNARYVISTRDMGVMPLHV